MAQNQGWVCLWRKIKEKGWYKNSKYVHLWVHLLSEVNHEDAEFLWNGKTIVVKKGQMITGRQALSRGTGINEKTIDRILKLFENEHQIKQQTTNKFRLITILNWKRYQEKEQQSEQHVSNRRATDEQQTSTNNNVNNVNNGNKDIAASAADPVKKEKKNPLEPMSLEVFISKCKASPARHIQIIADYAEQKKAEFTTRGQWDVFIKRNVRAAKDLSPYSDKQIGKAVSEILKAEGGYLSKWTLETILKYLTK